MLTTFFKQHFKKILWIVLGLLLIEGALRLFFGFGTPPLFISDPDYEYIYAPNQDIHRFGGRLITNNFSMRSDALSVDDSIRVLIFGDSILNGGMQTDQDELATSIMEREISAKLNKKIRFLNVAAASWGPDNAAAYLRKHGDFGAKMIVLVYSSHDLYDNMNFEKIVGVNRNYPAKNPLCAITEALGYFKPMIKRNFTNRATTSSVYKQKHKEMNPGWKYFIDYAAQHHLPLLVYLHAEKRESIDGYYNKYGQRLIQYLDSAKVSYVLELDHKPNVNMLRDFIHFNKDGQRLMANVLEPVILKTLKKLN